MADLEVIEQFLNIDTDTRKLRDGKRKKNNNQYYYFKDRFYIIKLSNEKWMITSDNDTTRRLLRKHIWYAHPKGYAQTHIRVNDKNTTTGFHRLVLDANDTGDHINKKTFDNRKENLRDVTIQDNNRNTTKHRNNTSGKQGVDRCRMRGHSYWRASIRNDNNKRISKYFSINKYGDVEAKRLAIEKRKELEQLYGYLGD